MSASASATPRGVTVRHIPAAQLKEELSDIQNVPPVIEQLGYGCYQLKT